MHAHKLPVYIDPLRMASTKAQLEGTLPLSSLQRICELLMETSGDVKVELAFGIDEENYTFVKGVLRTDLTLECQRCLSAFALPLEIPMLLSPVSTIDEAKHLPERYEPLMLSDESLKLTDIIEEEILLNIPLIPRHSEETCSVDVSLLENEKQNIVKQSPFDKLAVLKTNKKT